MIGRKIKYIKINIVNNIDAFSSIVTLNEVLRNVCIYIILYYNDEHSITFFGEYNRTIYELCICWQQNRECSWGMK